MVNGIHIFSLVLILMAGPAVTEASAVTFSTPTMASVAFKILEMVFIVSELDASGVTLISRLVCVGNVGLSRIRNITSKVSYTDK